MKKENIKHYLSIYLKSRPLFLSMIRAKEASIYQAYLPFQKPILDVGTGDGFFAKTVFGNIDTGIDIKYSRMGSAKNFGAYRELKEFDGVNIPYKNYSFSTVVSNCVFEHVDDLSGLLAEIFRVINPGGRLITTVASRPWEENFFGSRIFGSAYKAYMRKKQVHLNLFTKREWDEVFQKNGFRIEKCIGYLSPKACEMIDLSHYLSVPSLITYKLFGKWVIFPHIKPYKEEKILTILSENVEPEKSGALFYLLRKKS